MDLDHESSRRPNQIASRRQTPPRGGAVGKVQYTLLHNQIANTCSSGSGVFMAISYERDRFICHAPTSTRRPVIPPSSKARRYGTIFFSFCKSNDGTGPNPSKSSQAPRVTLPHRPHLGSVQVVVVVVAFKQSQSKPQWLTLTGRHYPGGGLFGHSAAAAAAGRRRGSAPNPTAAGRASTHQHCATVLNLNTQ